MIAPSVLSFLSINSKYQGRSKLFFRGLRLVNHPNFEGKIRDHHCRIGQTTLGGTSLKVAVEVTNGLDRGYKFQN